jgi:hypothetical protein
MSVRNRIWTCTVCWVLTGCAEREDVSGLPQCAAPEVQQRAQQAAAESVKVPFKLSTFSEVAAESTAAKRACRVRAKHAASGAAIWMRFTLSRRLVKAPKKGQPAEELAVVFAPIE